VVRAPRRAWKRRTARTQAVAAASTRLQTPNMAMRLLPYALAILGINNRSSAACRRMSLLDLL